MAKKLHFRVHTLNLLNEIVECSLPKSSGVLFVPINTFKNLLGEVAKRATELNDPVLNRIMFDLTLYELPDGNTPEYNKIMKQVYLKEEKFLKSLK